MQVDAGSTLLSIGGYALSILMGVILFMLKRELVRHEEHQKSLEGLVHAHKSGTDDRYDRLAACIDERYDDLVKSVHVVREDLLRHSAEDSARFLTKDEFLSSSSYLTTKTEEVLRILQGIEASVDRRR